MKKVLLVAAIILSLTSAATKVALTDDNTAPKVDKDLATDLALLQGSWELFHGNNRSVKTIEGNTETLHRYSIITGKLRSENSVEFKLSKSGSVHVFTFFAVGGSPEKGLSYVYKVDKGNFYDIPGLLHGDEYRNYQSKTRIWHWKRISEKDRDVPAAYNFEASEN